MDILDWTDPKYKDGFVIIPAVVAFDPRLKAADRAVMDVLAYGAFGRKTEMHYGNKKIAAMAGLKPVSIPAVLKRLEGFGLIRRVETKQYKTGRIIVLLWKISLQNHRAKASLENDPPIAGERPTHRHPAIHPIAGERPESEALNHEKRSDARKQVGEAGERALATLSPKENLSPEALDLQKFARSCGSDKSGYSYESWAMNQYKAHSATCPDAAKWLKTILDHKVLGRGDRQNVMVLSSIMRDFVANGECEWNLDSPKVQQEKKRLELARRRAAKKANGEPDEEF